MDNIDIRYGERVTLPIDTGDATDVSADLYVGKPGELYILTKHATLTNGAGSFVLTVTDTSIPLDTYNYQVNVIDGSGEPQKFPSPKNSNCGDCDDEEDFPTFTVHEALDSTEVS